MRTLKKTLCLVLCLAMMAGLCAICASAAFTDAEEITHKEAVELMSGLGIINGIPQDDGTFKFDPKGTLDRASACKIIAYILGDSDVKGTSDFTDVKGTWAEGVIAYCAAQGIVAGKGDGTFGPTELLTGAAFGKMLLVALGYNATAEGMVGADWEVNVAKLIKKTGLSDGIEKFDATKAIAREEACEMAANALFVPMVEYASTGVTITTGDVQISTGASKAEAITPYEFLSENFNLDFDGDYDDYGRSYWFAYDDVDGDGNFDAKETVYATFVEEPVLVLEGKSTCGDLYTKLGLKASAAMDFTAPGLGASGTVTAAKGSTAGLGMAGDTVEVYYDEYYETYSLIIIDTKIYTVAEADIVKVDGKQTGTKIAGVATESIYAKGDVVLYELANGKIHNDRLAEKFTAKATGYSAANGTVKVNGATYTMARNADAGTWYGSLTAEKVFYADENKNVYFTTDVAGAGPVAQTDFVYVVKYNEQAYVAADADVLNPQAAKAAAVKAEVIYTDGTHAAVALNIVGNATAGFKYAKPAADGTVAANTTVATNSNVAVGTWFAYTEKDDGSIVLAKLDADYAKLVGADVALTKGTAGTVEGKKVTSATKFVSIDTKYAATETAGLVKVDMTKAVDLNGDSTPDVDNTILVTYAKGSSTVAAVYAVYQAAPVAPTTYTGMAYAVAAGDTVADGVEWSFYEDGKLVTYVISGTQPEAKKVYKLTKDAAKDIYTVGTALVDVTVTGTKVTIADDTFFTAGSDFYYQTNTVICNVAKGHTGEADTIAVGDSVVVYEVGGKLAAVYIVAEAE